MTGAVVTGASVAMVVVMGTAGVMVAVTDTLTGVVVVMVVAGGMLTDDKSSGGGQSPWR